MCRQSDVTAPMRAILVDWLVEVQENFELFHETLYLAVRLVDLYLSRNSAVKREYLQLVGATAMLIASKFEVSSKRDGCYYNCFLCGVRSCSLRWWTTFSTCVTTLTRMLSCCRLSGTFSRL